MGILKRQGYEMKYIIVYHNKGGALRFHEILKYRQGNPDDPPSGLWEGDSCMPLGQDVGHLVFPGPCLPAWCYTIPAKVII